MTCGRLVPLSGRPEPGPPSGFPRAEPGLGPAPRRGPQALAPTSRHASDSDSGDCGIRGGTVRHFRHGSIHVRSTESLAALEV